MFTKKALVYTLQGTNATRASSGQLKELAIRIRSVTNIQKITKTMNMISSAKYAKAVKELESARSFGAAGAGAVKSLTADAAPSEGGHVILIAGSDRGMCGAFHTNLARAAAAYRKEKGDNCKYVVLGEKAKVTLKGLDETKNIIVSAKEICRNPPTFSECSEVAEALLSYEGFKWDSGTIFYNQHVSAMTQEVATMPVSSEEGLASAEGIALFDSVDDDIIKSYAEFALATTLFGCVKENFISEQGARMISMDGAAKNAGDMIDRMTLKYNRMRQAVITTELCEIIAGMAAL